jgi:hypothetical protein
MKKILILAILFSLFVPQISEAHNQSIIFRQANKLYTRAYYSSQCYLTIKDYSTDWVKFYYNNKNPLQCNFVSLKHEAKKSGLRYDERTDTFYLSQYFQNIIKNHD